MSPMATKAAVIGLLSVITLWMGALAGAPLKGAPVRIVRLEVARSPARVNELFGLWRAADSERWQARLLESLHWDTWLICGYAPLFCLWLWCVSSAFGGSYDPIGKIGRVLAVAQLFAGMLDFVENAGLAVMIKAGTAASPWPQVTSSASLGKWFLLCAGALYFLAALARLGWAILAK